VTIDCGSEPFYHASARLLMNSNITLAAVLINHFGLIFAKIYSLNYGNKQGVF